MEANGEVKLRTHELEQLCPKVPRKVSIPIIHDESWKAPIVYKMLEEYMGGLLDETFLGGRNEGGILRISVYHHKGPITPLTCR